MQPCPGCRRYIRGNESSCPFCSTRLYSDPAPAPRGLAAMALFVGLALAGCTDDGMGEDEADSSDTDTTGGDTDGADTSTTGNEDPGDSTSTTGNEDDETTTDTTTESESTTGMEETTVDDNSEQPGETYAGPDPGDWTDTTDDGWDTSTDTDTDTDTTG